MGGLPPAPDRLPDGFSVHKAIHAARLVETAYALYQQWSDAGKPPEDRMRFTPVVRGTLVFDQPFWRTLTYRQPAGTGKSALRFRTVREHTPAGACARRGRHLFIVFRGTLSSGEKLSNWMAGRMDAVFDNLDRGGVHRGFHRCYESVREAVHGFAAAHASPERHIRIAGHSLGGALAFLAGMDIATGGLPFRTLEIHAFGSPLVGSARWARHYDRQRTATWRIVNRRDFITRIPPTLLGYRHAGTPVRFTSPRGVRPHGLSEAYLPALLEARAERAPLSSLRARCAAGAASTP